MKKVKKGFWILILVLVFSTVATADVLPWPENDYFIDNEEDMELITGGYMVNCSGNKQKFYSAPGKLTAVFTVPRGEIIYPSYRCTKDGEEWCIVESWGNNYSYSGWCPMEALLPLYNSNYFTEEHADEIGEGFTEEYKEGTVLYFYSYPGSGISPAPATVFDQEPVEFERSYTDSEGRKWGYVSYWYGIRDCWLCADDPTNDSLPFVSVAMKNDGSYIEAYTIPEFLSNPTTQEAPQDSSHPESTDPEESTKTLEVQEENTEAASMNAFLIPILIVSLLVIVAVLGLMWIIKKHK